MNEAETRAELIDPKLKESGWGIVEGSKILREYHITAGKIQTGGRHVAKHRARFGNRDSGGVLISDCGLPIAEQLKKGGDDSAFHQ